MFKSLAQGLLIVLASALAWILLWPAQFGGRAHWLVVQGADLAPYYSDGALVIAHEQAEYAEGSLVAAHGADGPILGLAGEVPTDVLGAPWMTIGGAGDLLMGVANVILSWPFLLAVLLVSIASLVVRRHRPETATEQHQPTTDWLSHTLAS